MLKISPSAAAFITTQCVERNVGDGGGMRVFARTDAEQRERLKMRYVPKPQPDDQVLEKGAARVFVAKDAIKLVDPFVLDAAPAKSAKGAKTAKGSKSASRLVLRNAS